MPAWLETEPEQNSFRSIFKWGAKNSFKHPSPGFYAVIKQALDLSDTQVPPLVNIGEKRVEDTQKTRIASEDIHLFEEIVGLDNLSFDTYSRLKYSTGRSMEDILNLRQQKIDNICDLVLHPRSKADIRKIVSLCHIKKIPLHVYGGGSSVTLGLACPKGGVTLVMGTHMNRLLHFNEINQTITVEAGMMGPVYEELLNHAPEKLNAEKRYTGGHFPQSFEYSSVGGWVVTLGSGQASSYFGDACDLVISQEYITPTGEFKTHAFPATATGPKLNDIMKGSEGCFGVLIAVTMKIFQYHPETSREFTFMFHDFETAITAARRISQAEFGMPSILRLSDPEETDIAMKMYGLEDSFLDRFMKFKGLKPGSRCLLMGQTDGKKSFSTHLFNQIKKLGKKSQGLYLTGYPMKKWRKGRFSDPYMRDALNDAGILIDTLEAAVTWDHLKELYTAVRGYIKQHPNTICMTHASHFYAQGTNLYFIFITKLCDVDEFRSFQRGIIEKIQENFGSLSHHHGVGKMMAPFMENHLGKTQMAVLRAIKNHFDPHHIMNPGGLGI
ncbi:MAG: FAD-binding oxidoreductase [Proteobacteria bacterium]|nr:FAD-binding oxidoreductase [Pseudomonadota bacterium]MBU1584847.1 FAD-binding oxidoreductase [Pseudomonadota bacterium]MBU2629541.1 FAD-binding oxidoreductase [Pseudomonadota bacterium]